MLDIFVNIAKESGLSKKNYTSINMYINFKRNTYTRSKYCCQTKNLYFQIPII